MAKIKTTRVPISEIEANKNLFDTQLRAKTSPKTIKEYADILSGEVTGELPPIRVVRNPTSGLYLIGDGFKRFLAHKQVGFTDIDCIVIEGDEDDALLIAASANSTHGEPRTQEDRRKTIVVMLTHQKFGNQKEFSDRKIAELCSVSQPTVSAIRAALASGLSGEEIIKHGPNYAPASAAGAGEDESSEGESEADDVVVVRDNHENIVPNYLIPVFGPGTDLAALRKAIGETKFDIRGMSAAAKEIKDYEFSGTVQFTKNSVTELKRILKSLTAELPDAICPYCKARKEHPKRKVDICRVCSYEYVDGEGDTVTRNRGWVTLTEWNSAPESLKVSPKTANDLGYWAEYDAIKAEEAETAAAAESVAAPTAKKRGRKPKGAPAYDPAIDIKVEPVKSVDGMIDPFSDDVNLDVIF